MGKVLIAVDDSKGSVKAINAFLEFFSGNPPEIVLLYVEKIQGGPIIDEMMGDTEMSTMKEMLKGTAYQEQLDKKAKKILAYYTKLLEEKGITGVKALVREGHPADEILKASEEEGVGMIVIGSRGRRAHKFLIGSVSREVSNRAEISVMVAK